MSNNILSNLKTNKEKILAATIQLLDEKDYYDVSMRDIASAVGIKASSIYNHFLNKEAVLDEMVAIFKTELRKRQINDSALWKIDELDLTDPKTLLLHIMTEPLTLFDDPILRQIIRIVTKCQYYHAGIRAFLIEEMFDRPQNLLKCILRRMAELGLITDFPIDFLAAELQGVMIADFYRVSLHKPAVNFNPDRIRLALEKHVEFFWRAARKI